MPYRRDSALVAGDLGVVIDVDGDDDSIGRGTAVADESPDGSCEAHATSTTSSATAMPTTRERRMLF
ncbi:MAG TPA: hypothetical protein VNO51_25885 [Ilumatobacteraceae bacterium]|nr:hypothetical protein [Ilumatobacteraceae bacterium]